MATPEPKTSTFRAIVQQWAVDGVGIVIAILFFAIVIIIVTVAVASSKSPWDTVIAALAMTSQAFFGGMVYRLSKAQLASTKEFADRQDGFARQTADRQHKIDMYPLRKVAIANLDAAIKKLTLPISINDEQVEAFRVSFLEIKHLFSDAAETMSFDLYQATLTALNQFIKAQAEADESGSSVKPAMIAEVFVKHDTTEILADKIIDLQNKLDEEMMLR